MDPTQERLAAALAGRYRIEREIGAGGMATVYRAEDLKHHRQVAIKVLRPDLAAAVGPERFQDEIEIAARLHHPHIVQVYDSGEAGGFLYYVMPLVEGQSLRERVASGGRVPVQEVVRILVDVADALAHAHARHLVHRDIKPENLMMSGRHALVMDFGVAKAIRDAGSRRSSTSSGLTLGTPEYMSPEQARGDPDLDHRADLYSLGVVGYELLAGAPPFAGGGAESVLMRHITQPPEPITALRPDAPPALAAALMRALAKSPAERWQSAEDLRDALEPLLNTTSGNVAATRALPVAPRDGRARRLGILAGVLLGGAAIGWFVMRAERNDAPVATAPAGGAAASAGATAPGIPDLASDPSIAVLPFQNMSSDPEQAYFSDGISEELLNLLAKLPKLRVIARTSSFQFRDAKLGVAEIAEKLKVAAVLEGSVRRAGDRVRITVQLIRARDGTHLWSETYDRTLDDIFAVQDEIAANVARELELRLLSGLPKARPVDARVYPLLLQADALIDLRNKDAEQRALSLLHQARAIAPDEARVWAGMGRYYLNSAVLGGEERVAKAREARSALERALELDPDNALAMSRLAIVISQLENNVAGALPLVQRSVELAPNDTRVLGNAVGLVYFLGRYEEAARFDARLVQLDPANPNNHGALGSDYMALGRWDEAEAAFRDCLALSPDISGIRTSLAFTLLLGGKDPALALAEARAETFPVARAVVMPVALLAAGQRREADAALGALEKMPGADAMAGVALNHAWRRDADAAFAWLERARDADPASVLGVHADAVFRDRLAKDPRWLPFLRSIGKAPQQLARYKVEITLPE